MASCVRIYSEVEVVLAISDLYHCIQVAALEITFKGQLFSRAQRRIHPSEDTGVLRFEVGMELTEVGSHVRVACICASFVFEGIRARHFQVHSKTTAEPLALFTC